MEKLKEKIVLIYKTLGITQAEFCRRTDINVSNLSTVLSNQDKGVSASMIYGVSKIPNINMNWFLKDEGNMLGEQEAHLILLEEKHKKELGSKQAELDRAEAVILTLERLIEKQLNR
jgi:transcriptional regulator with XRE-family HTH domain|tara:strand:+ start:1713 stop:2063 length:351 start_codon:yes stop_codon:yes gene_type:complete